jgi:putative flippase GtrA
VRKRRFALFASVGVLVTIVGIATVALITMATGRPVLANAVGYTCGLILSYALNGRYTFGQSRTIGSALRFLACFLVAFVANLGVVYLAIYRLGIPKVVGSLAGLPVYTIAFYILCEKWAFNGQSRD